MSGPSPEAKAVASLGPLMYSVFGMYSSSTFWSWLSFQSATVFSNHATCDCNLSARRVELPEFQRRVLRTHRHPVDEGKSCYPACNPGGCECRAALQQTPA